MYKNNCDHIIGVYNSYVNLILRLSRYETAMPINSHTGERYDFFIKRFKYCPDCGELNDTL